MVLFRVISVSSSFSLSFYPLFFVYSALFLFPLQSLTFSLTHSLSFFLFFTHIHNIDSISLSLSLYLSLSFRRYVPHDLIATRVFVDFYCVSSKRWSPLSLSLAYFFTLSHSGTRIGKYIRVNSYSSSLARSLAL